MCFCSPAEIDNIIHIDISRMRRCESNQRGCQGPVDHDSPHLLNPPEVVLLTKESIPLISTIYNYVRYIFIMIF